MSELGKVHEYIVPATGPRIPHCSEPVICGPLGERVIRCRDCRFFEPEFVYEERHEEVHCSEFLKEPPGCGRFKTSGVVPNGFCMWAEPREES
jgi:hypothetical protein